MRRVTLVSSVDLSAPNTDAKLLMPVDLVLVKDEIWVTSRTSSLICKYSRKGCLNGTIAVPTPTGICVSKVQKCRNNCRSKCECLTVYVASTNGSVYKIESDKATVHVTPGGMLTGVAWLDGYLYVVENQNGFVAVYKDNGTTATSGITPNSQMIKASQDKPLFSVGYKPYGIRALGSRLYITYSNMSAKQGAGYVSIYEHSECGDLTRLINRENLSIPYGIAEIENEERKERSNILLIANNGSGYLSQFSLCEDRAIYTTNLRNISDGDFVVDGIMGLAQCDDRIYYVASADGGKIGSMGVFYSC